MNSTICGIQSSSLVRLVGVAALGLTIGGVAISSLAVAVAGVALAALAAFVFWKSALSSSGKQLPQPRDKINAYLPTVNKKDGVSNNPPRVQTEEEAVALFKEYLKKIAANKGYNLNRLDDFLTKRLRSLIFYNLQEIDNIAVIAVQHSDMINKSRKCFFDELIPAYKEFQKIKSSPSKQIWVKLPNGQSATIDVTPSMTIAQAKAALLMWGLDYNPARYLWFLPPLVRPFNPSLTIKHYKLTKKCPSRILYDTAFPWYYQVVPHLSFIRKALECYIDRVIFPSPQREVFVLPPAEASAATLVENLVAIILAYVAGEDCWLDCFVAERWTKIAQQWTRRRFLLAQSVYLQEVDVDRTKAIEDSLTDTSKATIARELRNREPETLADPNYRPDYDVAVYMGAYHFPIKVMSLG